MAHHQSAKKSIRQTVKRTAINRDRKSRIRTFLTKVEAAIASGDKVAAQAALRVAEPELMAGVTRNIFKLNTAARKISRLSARIKALAA